MAAILKFALLSIVISAGERPTHTAYTRIIETKTNGVFVDSVARERQPAEVGEEMRAQEVVAQLLKERRAQSSHAPSQALSDWVPAVSLEAQQGMLPHQQLEHEFRAQFEEVIGIEGMATFELDLKDIMKDLTYTFASLAKNEYGDVGHTAVRYALHRLFVARHGWYIRGLDPEGNGFSTSSPAQVLKGQVPDKVYTVVEKLLYGRGFGLYETAVLGAVLEILIHKEAISRAAVVFKLLDMKLHQIHSAADVDNAIDYYMMAYILGHDVTTLTSEQAHAMRASIELAYPGWKQTQPWLRSIREKHGSGTYSFSDFVKVLIDVGDKHGKFQQSECMGLKKQLMDLENVKNGCVPAGNFYKGMLEDGSKWQFSETPQYLHDAGILDESEANNPKVMIPNYLGGPSNCVASSGYYSVCCLNECEEILGRIERHIQAPDALPEELINLVVKLPSDSVQADRTLPASLQHRLAQVAEAHGGRVPLHSRLFMQWMHNAYPHECPYPHPSGKTKPRGRFTDIVAPKEMEKFVKSANATSATLKNAQCGQWLEDEELYVPWVEHPSEKDLRTRDDHVAAMTSAIVLLVASASVVLTVLHTCRSMRSASKKPYAHISA